ncbi:WxcM-like domain-containing protein [Myroides sp. NP-2]|uniref:WxcM-like domain-containing protein n=1 Tax=Myroides sp. NP-2 TaxID=2759945 RepID=UPI0015F8938C|nr:WxcM-like domain-containing protein [Myroides sp. NP-2]MBB1149743.1 WxcM-like domain-containing protein [Myroides sp. NP-2]
MIVFNSGESYLDTRGKLLFNNTLDLSIFKRLYIIENRNNSIIRGWQGHKVEQRLFFASQGIFSIRVVKVDDFDNPCHGLTSQEYILKASTFDSLLVSPGFATAIKALENESQLLCFSDYLIGETNDDYKFDIGIWK